MSYKYCCFISYPHGQGDIMKPVVEDFIEGLKKEIYPLTKNEIYYDDKLKAGHKWRGELGQNLCRSVCMILIYTPIYFHKDDLNCARELKAMEDLEKKRLKKLGDRGTGLIIPVILRGSSKFPKALKEKTFYKDFSSISFSNTRSKIKNIYAPQIREIAEYIADRCSRFDELGEHGEDLWQDCGDFNLPDDEEVKKYVAILLGNNSVEPPFPNRREKKR